MTEQASETADRAVVATVGGDPMYGTQAEATAARLPYGSRVRVTRPNGDIIHGRLVSTWYGLELMFTVELDIGGRANFCFELGDAIEPVDSTIEKRKS